MKKKNLIGIMIVCCLMSIAAACYAETARTQIKETFYGFITTVLQKDADSYMEYIDWGNFYWGLNPAVALILKTGYAKQNEEGKYYLRTKNFEGLSEAFDNKSVKLGRKLTISDFVIHAVEISSSSNATITFSDPLSKNSSMFFHKQNGKWLIIKFKFTEWQ